MNRALLLVTLVFFGCASKPPPKVCSAEAPPAHDKGPVSIGMCPSDVPPPVASTAASTDAGIDAMPDDIDAAPVN